MKSLTFKVEDIFEEIQGDPENILLKFPPEIIEETGWAPGEVLDISVEDDKIIIKSHGKKL